MLLIFPMNPLPLFAGPQFRPPGRRQGGEIRYNPQKATLIEQKILEIVLNTNNADGLFKRSHRREKKFNVSQGSGAGAGRLTVQICPFGNSHFIGSEVKICVAASPNLQPPGLPTEKYKGWCIDNLCEMLDSDMTDMVKDSGSKYR